MDIPLGLLVAMNAFEREMRSAQPHARQVAPSRRTRRRRARQQN